jgi:hypothetical protein
MITVSQRSPVARVCSAFTQADEPAITNPAEYPRKPLLLANRLRLSGGVRRKLRGTALGKGCLRQVFGHGRGKRNNPAAACILRVHIAHLGVPRHNL